MDVESVTKRAGELQVGDRIVQKYLTFAISPGEVLLTTVYEYLGNPWVFAAYRLESGLHDSVSYLPHAAIEVIPAPDRTGLAYTRADDDAEDPTPTGPREPLHTGGMTEGGLVDETVSWQGLHVKGCEGAFGRPCACLTPAKPIDETGGYWDPSVTSVPAADYTAGGDL